MAQLRRPRSNGDVAAATPVRPCGGDLAARAMPRQLRQEALGGGLATEARSRRACPESPRGSALAERAIPRQLRPRRPRRRPRSKSDVDTARHKRPRGSDLAARVAAAPLKRPHDSDLTRRATSRQFHPRRKGPAVISHEERCRDNSAQETPQWQPRSKSDVAAAQLKRLCCDLTARAMSRHLPPKRPCGGDLTTRAMLRRPRPRSHAAATSQHS